MRNKTIKREIKIKERNKVKKIRVMRVFDQIIARTRNLRERRRDQ